MCISYCNKTYQIAITAYDMLVASYVAKYLEKLYLADSSYACTSYYNTN